MEAQHESGGIESGGGSQRLIWVISVRIGDFRESRVHLIHVFLTFTLNVTFLCKLRQIRDLRCALEFLNVVNSVSEDTFLRKLRSLSDSR